MRYLILLFFALPLDVAAQNNIVFNAGLAYTNGAPTFTPGAKGSRYAIDTVTFDIYENTNPATSNWLKIGDRIQELTGCAVPSYTPTKHQSIYVTNQCTTPILYKWNGSAWREVGGGGGGGGSVVTDATLTGDGTVGDPLSIAQQGAETSQVITWSGTTWEPSWGNPYTFVTSTSTVTADVNEVLVGTQSASITIGLPTCNATNDSKRFKIVKNGTDSFSVTVDPASTQLFYDGSAIKIFFGKLSIDCTCRFSGGTGVWFFDNM
jgi:hypothetical protein